MGADAVLNPAEPDFLGRLRKAAGAEGVDVSVEMSGNPKGIELALKSVRNGGRFTAFGLPGARLELDYANDIVFKGIKIYGIAGLEIFRSWYKMESLLKSKAIDIRPVITHVFAMKDHKKAFETMTDKEKKCGKIILVP